MSVTTTIAMMTMMAIHQELPEAAEEMKEAEQSLSVPSANPAMISTLMSAPLVVTVTKKELSNERPVALSQVKTESSFEVWVLLS